MSAASTAPPSSSATGNPVSAVSKPRVKHNSGLHLDSEQSVDVPANLKNEICIIPSTSQPNWGSFFTCDLKEKPAIIKGLTLQFQTSTLTCTGTVANYPRFIPAHYFFTRIELVVNSQVIDTVYGNEQFLLTQWKHTDIERISLNDAAGNYSAGVQRNTLATAVSPPTFYVTLDCFVNQAKYMLLTDAHNIQIRVYLDNLANVVDLGSGQSAPVNTITACNLIAELTRLPSDIANQQLTTMTKTPFDSIFHDLRYGLFTIQSGVATTNIVLTPIVGKVAALFFTVRPTASLVNASAFNYTGITSFSILNSASTNIVGGQAIPSQLALTLLNQKWCKSSYTNETAYGSNITGAVESNGAYVYMWAFSSDVQAALARGLCLNSYQFTGNEQLQINFASTLAAPVQVDVYALTESYLEQGATYVKKVSM